MGQRKGHLAVVFGVVLFEIRANRVEIGDRLCRSDSRLQMSNSLKYPAHPAGVQIKPIPDLLSVHNRNKKIGIGKQECPVEPRWGYAEDGKRMLVHLNNPA